MEKRAIVLLLSRSSSQEGLGKPAFSQDNLFRMKLSWDRFNTINSTEKTGDKTIEVDLTKRMPKSPATRAINN